MKKSIFISLILCCVLLMTACHVRESEKNSGDDPGDVSGIKIEEKDGIKYFRFEDAEGNEYEARLDETVPACPYDSECFFTDGETGYKSYLDEGKGITAKTGIDVSEFQGEEIDWKQVRDAGIEFVIIRLGYRAYGESGELVLDAMFDRNVQGALDAGLQVGVYFFSQAITASEAVEEAEYVLEHIRTYDIDGPVVYDTEDIKWDTARTDINTDVEFTNFCKVFCDIIESEGYDSMIYANLPWMTYTLKMDQLTDYDFWYADYHDLPECPYDYKIWQYSETGAVPGITGNVDLNIWFQEEKE